MNKPVWRSKSSFIVLLHRRLTLTVLGALVSMVALGVGIGTAQAVAPTEPQDATAPAAPVHGTPPSPGMSLETYAFNIVSAQEHVANREGSTSLRI